MFFVYHVRPPDMTILTPYVHVLQRGPQPIQLIHAQKVQPMTSPKWTWTMTSTPLYVITLKERQAHPSRWLRDPLTCATDRVEGTRLCRCVEAAGAWTCLPQPRPACLNPETRELRLFPRTWRRRTPTPMPRSVGALEVAETPTSSRCARAPCLRTCRSVTFQRKRLHSLSVWDSEHFTNQ